MDCGVILGCLDLQSNADVPGDSGLQLEQVCLLGFEQFGCRVGNGLFLALASKVAFLSGGQDIISNSSSATSAKKAIVSGSGVQP